MFKEKILEKVNLKRDFGYVLNELQDIACENLSKRSVNNYLRASCRDANACEGMDGMLINGHYWDWKEFFKVREIVSAWLDYFTESELQTIYANL